MHKGRKRVFPITGIVVSLLIIAFGVFGYFIEGLHNNYDGRTVGEITQVTHADDGYCTFQYTFSVGDETFRGNDSEFGSTCSKLQVDYMITIAYDTDNPKFNSAEYGLAGIGMVVFVTLTGLGILALCIARLVYIHRHTDTTGDGIGDNRPATKEQMKLIENGMRELGQFYMKPKRRPTHEQAKQIIKKINAQIAARRGRK